MPEWEALAQDELTSNGLGQLYHDAFQTCYNFALPALSSSIFFHIRLVSTIIGHRCDIPKSDGQRG
jgi:hypothetical protein